MNIINRFMSLIPHHTSPQLFDSGRGVPVYHAPDADTYLTWQGATVFYGAGRERGAVTPPFGAPLPPVPIQTSPVGHWLYPANAPRVPGFSSWIDNKPPAQTVKCRNC